MTALVVFGGLWLCIVGLIVCGALWLRWQLAWVDEWASEHAHRDAMAALAQGAPGARQVPKGKRGSGRG